MRISPPHAEYEAENHLLQRVGADATDCSRMSNQPRRARNHPGEDGVRRAHAGLKTPSCRGACGGRHVEEAEQPSVVFCLGGLPAVKSYVNSINKDASCNVNGE